MTTRPFLTTSGVEIAFVLIGLVTLGAGLLTVTTRRLVHAALWLVVALGGLAAEYLLLTAEFIAWVQVLIYIGSVVVLLLFGLMLTKAPIAPSEDADSGNWWVAAGVAGAAAVLLVAVVVDAFRSTWIGLGRVQGTAEATGGSLFRSWVLPFEALSVLLLAALVGAVVLSRPRNTGTPPAAGRAPAANPAPGAGRAPRKGRSPAAGRPSDRPGSPGDRPGSPGGPSDRPGAEREQR